MFPNPLENDIQTASLKYFESPFDWGSVLSLIATIAEVARLAKNQNAIPSKALYPRVPAVMPMMIFEMMKILPRVS